MTRRPSADTSYENFSDVYKLIPADLLLRLDLSLSTKSRLLSHTALRRFNGFVIQHRTIAGAGWVDMICNFAAMIAPVAIGGPCALVSTAFFLPALVAGFGFLRYEIVCHLLVPYNFWFCTLLNATTFAIIGVMMGDMRAMAILVAWGGIQNNVMIDAGVRAVRL